VTSNRFSGGRRVVDFGAHERRHVLDLRGTPLEIEVIRQRRRFAVGAGVPIGFPDDGEPFRIVNRRPPKQNVIDDAEYRGVGANAERECEEGNDRKRRRTRELANGVAEILAPHASASSAENLALWFRPAKQYVTSGQLVSVPPSQGTAES
jgi:hypothetical protein